MSMSEAGKKRARAQANVSEGKAGETVFCHMLNFMGCACVRRIETGWRVKRVNGRIVGASPMRAVAGDIAAVIPPAGRSVLVECKRRDGRLVWSDLEDHQHRALAAHAGNGGVSMLGWISGRGAYLLDYAELIGFGGAPAHLRKGKGISWDVAALLAIQGQAFQNRYA